MIKLKQCYVEDYKYDKEGSSKEEDQTRDHPGARAEYSIHIFSILVTEKTVLLKTLNKGDKVEFKIDQNFTLDGEDITLSGDGFGEISEINFLNNNQPDDEIQEIQIVLEDGGADQLVY